MSNQEDYLEVWKDKRDPDRVMRREEDARMRRARGEAARHSIGGRPIDNDPASAGYNPGQYGRTHDMDCLGCQGISFTLSPRSETYWSS